MTFVPHLRLTWSGTLPDGEIWSNSLSLVPDNSTFLELVSYSSISAYLREHVLAVNLTDDIVGDLTAYHARPTSYICSGAIMKKIVVAALDENGRYLGAPREAAVNVAGDMSSATFQFPHQIARKVTLETDDDIGRVKGGFYQPLPGSFGHDRTTNLWSTTVVGEVAASVKTLLENLENAPGLDDNSFRVVVASTGRRNKDGSVRMAPRNCDVKRVNVGRRVDVQRRRANKLSEARIADTTISEA